MVRLINKLNGGKDLHRISPAQSRRTTYRRNAAIKSSVDTMDDQILLSSETEELHMTTKIECFEDIVEEQKERDMPKSVVWIAIE